MAIDHPPSSGKPNRQPNITPAKIRVGRINAHHVARRVEPDVAVISTLSPGAKSEASETSMVKTSEFVSLPLHNAVREHPSHLHSSLVLIVKVLTPTRSIVPLWVTYSFFMAIVGTKVMIFLYFSKCEAKLSPKMSRTEDKWHR